MPKNFLVGGVNSPIRNFEKVGGQPIIATRGSGAFVFDTRGKKYLDFVQGFGSQILGHSHLAIMHALRKTIATGTTFGLTTKNENALARRLAAAIPVLEKIRFTTSGSEATQNAVRLAQHCTGRREILTFAGGYHGHALAQQKVLVARWNDPTSVARILQRSGNKIACLIAEPILGNAGLIPPEKDFWPAVGKMLRRQKVLLIADEVLTGFRVRYGAAGEIFGMQPDLITLGKVIGGGISIGAFGGREKLMRHVTPEGNFPHAGTFAGNPLAMAAGIAALDVLKKAWPQLEKKSAWFAAEMRKILPRSGVQLHAAGTLFGFFFSREPVCDFATAEKSDDRKFRQFFWYLARRGFLLSPSKLETAFVSHAQTRQDLRKFLTAVEEFFG